MKPPSTRDYEILKIIKWAPVKFKDVLIFEKPKDFDLTWSKPGSSEVDIFDFGYKDFYLCQTKAGSVDMSGSMYQILNNINQHYAVETTKPEPGVYAHVLEVKATWFGKNFVIRNKEFELERYPLGRALKTMIETYTEEHIQGIIDDALEMESR